MIRCTLTLRASHGLLVLLFPHYAGFSTDLLDSLSRFSLSSARKHNFLDVLSSKSLLIRLLHYVALLAQRSGEWDKTNVE